jgi:hypothetical protein
MPYLSTTYNRVVALAPDLQAVVFYNTIEFRKRTARLPSFSFPDIYKIVVSKL